MNKFCEKCRRESLDDANFCVFCGEELKQVICESISETKKENDHENDHGLGEQPMYQQPMYQQPAYQQPVQQQPVYQQPTYQQPTYQPPSAWPASYNPTVVNINQPPLPRGRSGACYVFAILGLVLSIIGLFLPILDFGWFGNINILEIVDAGIESVVCYLLIASSALALVFIAFPPLEFIPGVTGIGTLIYLIADAGTSNPFKVLGVGFYVLAASYMFLIISSAISRKRIM